MTSVAYSAQPERPGWLHETLSLVAGWLLSAGAIFVLYLAGTLVGALWQPYGSHAGVVDEWPFAENGLWSLLANLAVVCIALVLTTVVTSWRIAVVLGRHWVGATRITWRLRGVRRCWPSSAPSCCRTDCSIRCGLPPSPRRCPGSTARSRSTSTTPPEPPSPSTGSKPSLRSAARCVPFGSTSRPERRGRSHYHVFGLALGETLPARVSLGRSC